MSRANEGWVTGAKVRRAVSAHASTVIPAEAGIQLLWQAGGWHT